MVIGQTFAWGHIPKTGGDSTRAMFRLFPELIIHVDEPTTQDKHCSFVDREPATAGKLRLLNIRRLPAWNLSHAVHEAQGGLYPDYVPRPMRSSDEIAEAPLADWMISSFTGSGKLPVDRWLRTEHLKPDFLAFIADLTEVSEAHHRQVMEVPRINRREYDRDIWHWFTPRQVETMYRVNPLWAAVERQVYGDILEPSSGTENDVSGANRPLVGDGRAAGTVGRFMRIIPPRRECCWSCGIPLDEGCYRFQMAERDDARGGFKPETELHVLICRRCAHRARAALHEHPST